MENTNLMPVPVSPEKAMIVFDRPICSELVRRGMESLENQNAETWFKKAEQFRGLGDLKNAIECYEKAIALDAKHGAAFFWAGYCGLHHTCECFKDEPEKEHTGCMEKASDAYEHLLALHGTIDREGFYAADLNNYAVAKSRLGFRELALEYYRKAVEADENYYTAWTNLGITHCNLRQFGEAERCLTRSLKICKEYPDTFYNFGLLYKELGESEKAIQSFEDFLKYVDHNRAREKGNIQFAVDSIMELRRKRIRTKM